jgi:hypothetical protein
MKLGESVYFSKPSVIFLRGPMGTGDPHGIQDQRHQS